MSSWGIFSTMSMFRIWTNLTNNLFNNNNIQLLSLQNMLGFDLPLVMVLMRYYYRLVLGWAYSAAGAIASISFHPILLLEFRLFYVACRSCVTLYIC